VRVDRGVARRRLARVEAPEPNLLEAEPVQVVRGRRLEIGAWRPGRLLLHGLRHEDLAGRVGIIGGAVVLLPYDPGNRVVARNRGTAGDRGILGRAVRVDFERLDERGIRPVLTRGKPSVRGRVEAAREDVR